jgi:hypothetical protein
MAVMLYMDQHVPRAVTAGLRVRGVDVITAYEDGASAFEDPDLLDRATSLNRVLITFDDDLLVEASRRQREGEGFSGVIFAHPLRISVGVLIHDLELIAVVGEAHDLANQVIFLPL